MIYLDNSATTQPCKRSVEYLNDALQNSWGNPSSLHTLGVEAEIVLSRARETLASYIKALPGEIIFTGSGTEANNTAIMSALSKRWGNRVITTEIEHPSVLKTVERLEKEGFEVIRLKPQKNGKISLADLEDALTAKTVLVSIMLVNNEVGSIQPIAEAAKLIKRISPRALFHCDAVQGFGKISINVKTLGVDMLTVSGHKVFAPKGIGFLYCKKGVTISPLLTGGGQENGMRSGTESVPLVAAFEGAVLDLPSLDKSYSVQEKLWQYAKSLFENCNFARINSPEDALPYILNISVPGYRSETLMHFLESQQIYVSSGSACAKGETSHVLSALGLNRAEIDSALRISFSVHNTKEDVDALFAALQTATQKLRRSNI